MTCHFAVSSSVVQSMAKAADMSVSEFAAQTGRALTGQATRQDNFVYQTKLRGTDLQVESLKLFLLSPKNSK